MKHCINLANPLVLAKGGAVHATLPSYPVKNSTLSRLFEKIHFTAVGFVPGVRQWTRRRKCFKSKKKTKKKFQWINEN